MEKILMDGSKANRGARRAQESKLTKGQRKFLEAVASGAPGIFHSRVVNPVFDAGFVFPRQDNFLFWIVGCNGHAASGFALQQAGLDALTG